jgi:hypothetical protein
MVEQPLRTTRGRAPHAPSPDDSRFDAFSRALVVGVGYGLVGWFHLVLCPTYVAAGLLSRGAFGGMPVGPEGWAVVFGLTGLLMIAVALGIVSGRRWAWRVAPWCVVPNLAAHLVFIAVLPVWGAIAIAADLVALWFVLGEQRRRTTRRPTPAPVASTAVRPSRLHDPAQMIGRHPHFVVNRRPR